VKTEKPKNLDFYYDYIFEPSKDEIIQQLIPMSLKIQFLKVLFESNASEQGARMTAMHQATDNATELLRDLTLTYNKLRQTSITSEILEIVSGAEALKGQ
jgi:F-type H+-transporting ATPase subunit gamma